MTPTVTLLSGQHHMGIAPQSQCSQHPTFLVKLSSPKLKMTLTFTSH